ncbi:hypothetical protein ISN44_As06g023260 [Arabidopsis suecica]|uniref:Hydroxyproline-rich glycoprotein family protein n=1 Tax=Arabidopsis suecica TaxID=45249 RepID=A0A8T2CF72_ARASU|nr:hypothetical protein ISN44_As06g023260 [Arabidopsis suecica]
MNTNNHGLLLLSSFFIFSLAYFPYLAISETPCPYPCYPTPPIGGSSSTPSMTQPPPYPPPAVNYPSPAGNLPNYPPPVGNIPNYPSPPYGGGDGSGSSFYGPPPPDAILPYFPYYYRKPPHQTDQTSSSSHVAVPGKLTVRIVAVANLVVVGVLGNILFIT